MPAERTRVMAFVTSFYAGGTERQIVSLARGLDRAGFDLRVACMGRTGDFLPEVEAEGIPVVDYPVRSLRRLHTFREQARFARYLRQERIQVLHAFNFYPNVFAVPPARLAGVPAVVATLRDMGDLWTPMQRRAQRWVCRLAHAVVANAEAVRDQALRDGYAAGKVRVIRNGLDLSRFETLEETGAARSALDLPAAVPIVAVFSRLNHPVKGIDGFLEAAARVAPSHPDALFLVVGDGPLRGGMEALAARLGLAGRVRFTGFRSDVHRLMRAVTLSVVPSRSEGLSNVLLESMAAGRPVVATRVGGTPEVVEEGITGLLVPPGDAGALARGIATMLDDPARAEACGRAGRRRVETLFSLRRMARETEDLYRLLLDRASRRPEPAPGVAL